jgi:GNAT superfamily N-acetyltransferase
MLNIHPSVLRQFNPDTDILNLVQLRVEIEANDQLGTNTSEASLRAQFDWPNHDPGQDRWVIESLDDGKLVGHGWTFAQSPLRAIVEVAVHPQWRRQGLGSQLLQKMIDRSREKGAIQIVAGAKANNKVGHPFLRARGFVPVGHNRFMTAPSDIQPETPVWPEDFSLQSYSDLGELSILVEGSNLCYTDMWGHRENMVPASVARFRERMTESPDDYYPEGILIIFDPDGQLAGICFNRPEGEEKKKVIDSPGVVPRYRPLGLQRPLVQASMRWLNQQVEGDYYLYTWGDFDEAVQIYHELGFTLTDDHHLIEYVLE